MSERWWGERPREPSSIFGVRCFPCSSLRRNESQPGPLRPDRLHKNIFRVGQPMSLPIRQSQRVNDKQTDRETKVGRRGPKGWQAGRGFEGEGRLRGNAPSTLDLRPSTRWTSHRIKVNHTKSNLIKPTAWEIYVPNLVAPTCRAEVRRRRKHCEGGPALRVFPSTLDPRPSTLNRLNFEPNY